MLKLNTWHS